MCSSEKTTKVILKKGLKTENRLDHRYSEVQIQTAPDCLGYLHQPPHITNLRWPQTSQIQLKNITKA